MSTWRVKQQSVSVIGLFKLAGRHKKMDDVFVNHECQNVRAHAGVTLKYIYI